jgi:hypothetical protein
MAMKLCSIRNKVATKICTSPLILGSHVDHIIFSHDVDSFFGKIGGTVQVEQQSNVI